MKPVQSHQRWLIPVTLVIAVSLLLQAGCSRKVGMPVSDRGQWLDAPAGPGIVARVRPLIADVAMPVGFVAIPELCSASLVGESRKVKHVYQGRATLQEVVDFYHRELPRSDWEPVEEASLDRGGYEMHYVKGPERLELVMQREASVVTITITIEPASPAMPARRPASTPNLRTGAVG